MKELLEETATGCYVTYRGDLDLGIARWNSCEHEQELVSHYEELLPVAKVHQCFRWLLDVRRRKAFLDLTASWLFPIFLPRLCETIGRLPRLAYVVSPHRPTTSGELMQSVYYTSSAEIFITENEGEAYEWLLRG